MTIINNKNEILGTYQNGNYTVTIYSDGTKVRETDADEFIPAFAENCDVTITTKCSQNCSFCYMGCTPTAKEVDLLSQPWINTLHPYTELALNGNDLDHPQLEDFLKLLHDKKIIANITVNQNQFMLNLDKLHKWCNDKLIYGLGVSLVTPTQNFIDEFKKFPNAVLHVINGIFNASDFMHLKDNDIKILILGYKTTGRGDKYLNSNNIAVKNKQVWMKLIMPSILQGFQLVSFDNLALNQLNIKSLVSPEKWNEIYMGPDGSATFFIDMVNGEYAMNSTCEKRYKILDNVDDMFYNIKKRNIESVVK